MDMKSIEERAWEKYPEVIKHHNLARIDINEEKRKIYIEIATEQKAIDEGIRLKKCDSMTKEEFERETTFLDQYIDGKDGMPSFSDAIEWARKEAIKEAASWFGDYLTELRDSVNWFYGSSKMKSGRDRFMEAMNK